MSAPPLDLTSVGNALSEIESENEGRALTYDELIARLTAAHFFSEGNLREVLAKLGFPNPSKRLMKRLAKDLKVFKCYRCAFFGEDLIDLHRHLKDLNHSFGQKQYRKDRRALMRRIKDRLKGKGLPHDFIPAVDANNEADLTPEEKNCWKNLVGDDRLTAAETATYQGLVHVAVCLCFVPYRIRRGTVATAAPSPNAGA